MNQLSLLLITTILLFSCHQPESTEVSYATSEKFRSMNLPFSEAVIVGNTIYLSGQIGNKPGQLSVVEGGIKEETKQAFENIKQVLERNGASIDNIVKCTIMLADINEWADFNAEYVKYFPDNKPARSAFATNGLALNARVEIECIAVLRK
ncbi:MAG: Rid family detoxifying hydrolase [Cyclobacteriaceae bacterium]|jgi:reactive intermediate/imine deaminase|nr:Rid family detoxifying hydrolase [Cyclobacteriaceae bacterium]